MRDYFLILFIAALVGTVVSLVADGKFEKQVRYLISLICVLIVLAPMKSAVEVFSDVPDVSVPVAYSVSDPGRWVLDRSVEELEHTVAEAAKYRFGIEVAGVKLVTVIGDGVTSVERLEIALHKSHGEYKDGIKEYFEKLLYVETEVYVLEE